MEKKIYQQRKLFFEKWFLTKNYLAKYFLGLLINTDDENGKRLPWPNSSENFISPSINILFFSGFLLYLKENFIENKDIELSNYTSKYKILEYSNLDNNNIKKYLRSLYYLLIFSFIPLIGFNLKFSILSYNIDFVLSLLTLILIHNISRALIIDKYDLGTLILIFLLPIFKLSGVISLISINRLLLFKLFLICFK